MGKGSAPKFDAGAATAAQGAANQSAYNASARAAGRSGPFGSSQYQFDASGNPTGVKTTLSAPLDAASNNIMGGIKTASGWLPQKQFSLSDVPAGMDVANAMFKQGMNYMAPQYQQQQKALEAQLFARGIPIGGNDVYKDATGNLNDAQNRGMQDLTMKSILAGQGEHQRMIQNALMERNQGYQDVNSQLGLLSNMGSLAPQAGNIGNMQAVDAMGAYGKQFDSQMAAHQQKQAGWQNLAKMGMGLAMAPMTGGGSLAGMAMGGLGGMFGGGGGGMVNGWQNNDPGGTYYQ